MYDLWGLTMGKYKSSPGRFHVNGEAAIPTPELVHSYWIAVYWKKLQSRTKAHLASHAPPHTPAFLVSGILTNNYFSGVFNEYFPSFDSVVSTSGLSPSSSLPTQASASTKSGVFVGVPSCEHNNIICVAST